MKKFSFFFIIFLANIAAAQPISSSFIDRLNISQIENKEGSLSGASDKQIAVALLRKYREKENIYLRVSDKDLASIKKNFPEEIKKSIEVADQVRRQYFLFRYEWDMEKTNIPYQFKKEIDWIKVPFGDNEWCWMLNRHRFWIDLGKAYFVTKNEAYAKTWVHQISDWIQKNPVADKKLRGFSWRRIEAGIRCENWIKSFEYFKNSSSVTPEFLCLFLNSLSEHAEFINSSFSDFSKTSNWGVLEHQGLFNVANFLTESKDAGQWRSDAIQKLEICAQNQILPDGTQWEQSPMYHNEVFHCYMNVNLIAQQQNIQLPQTIIDKTKAMAWCNVKWQKPNYHQPLLGDSDDSDLRGLLTLAASLFDDGGLKSRAYAELDFENLFILGTKQAGIYNKIIARNPDFLSVYQPGSGDMYMRDSWTDSASYASLHLKKLGCGHAHDDILHFSLFANGKDYLVDGGRFTYVDSDRRKELKSSESHNTLAVDGLPNSVYAESWSNSFNARSQGVYTRITDLYDYAEAENTAYKRLKDPVSMKRRFLYLKPQVWIVFDSFSANERHKYSQYFNFPDNEVALDSNGVKTTYSKDNLTIQAVKAVMIKKEARKWSPEYNLLKDNQRVEFYKESEGFDSFITALYFPEKSNITCTQLPVCDKNNVKLADNIAEAVEIRYNDKEFVLMVVHNSQAALSSFYKIKDQLVTGEVVLLEKVAGKYITHIIKE